jgi:enoyl-[acyl-carrier-protein] reductase (NADH)
MAAAILFLASDLARHVLGQVITVDGGLTICGKLPRMRVNQTTASDPPT